MPPVDSALAHALAAPEFRHEPLRKKPVVVLIIVLAGFLAGVPAALMAAVGAALLLITRTMEPRKVYDKVDWSVANIIVVEGAAAEGVQIGFRDYFRVGLPVTLMTLTLGSIWLSLVG
ncbi:MAG: hypothetical protein HYY76_13595 [Acidobacteria bacterium]|nr:hypothetical protein [Acidobacteriota bacterium]